MHDPKVISFPNRKRRAKPEGDAALAADVLKAWRALKRKVAVARTAGLHIEWPETESIEPHITRTF